MLISVLTHPFFFSLVYYWRFPTSRSKTTLPSTYVYQQRWLAAHIAVREQSTPDNIYFLTLWWQSSYHFTSGILCYNAQLGKSYIELKRWMEAWLLQRAHAAIYCDSSFIVSFKIWCVVLSSESNECEELLFLFVWDKYFQLICAASIDSERGNFRMFTFVCALTVS